MRSPAEFQHARIPGAVNLPLFSDEERKEVGTCYKQVGKQEAIHLGVSIVGPKLSHFLELANIYKQYPFRVYCWRGGMRSGFMSWFLQFTGIPCMTLEGGYKVFRRYVNSILDQPYHFQVLGGFTGSGKTERLLELADAGNQVIDLEALANHRGSAFGYLGPQPSNEQFENELAMRLSSFDSEKPIWVEDESRLIGTCVIPNSIYNNMQLAPFSILEVPLEQRLHRIVSMYGTKDIDALIASVEKIQKRLGSQRAIAAISLLKQEKFYDAFEIVLEYYDKTYAFSIASRTISKT